MPTKDEARKWYADIKPIILCTDQGDITLRSGTQKLLVVGLFEPGCPKRSSMYLKSQNEAAVENSRRVPTKDEARKWFVWVRLEK